MRRFAAILLTMLALTLAAACSGDDDSSDATGTTTEGPTATSEANASGGGSSEGGASGAPDLGDFDVPLPEWADAVAVDDSGPITVVQFIVPLDRQESTIAFYDDWTAGQPGEYLRTESESGGVSLQTDVAPGEEKTTITILSPLEGDDFVSVTVARGTFE